MGLGEIIGILFLIMIVGCAIVISLTRNKDDD